MEIRSATLDTCATATDTVVVIDVIRAFTTAAYAFAAGARDIVLVAEVDEAFALRERFPGSLVMGEVGGFPPPGFDLGNSPAALIGLDLKDKRLIQRTGAGTQGAVRCAAAHSLFAASFVCATATVRQIQKLSPTIVTLVSTGPEGEDQACADYLTALLRDETPATSLIDRARKAGLDRIATPDVVAKHSAEVLAAFATDIECCTTVDRFDFAMQVQRHDGLLVMTALS